MSEEKINNIEEQDFQELTTDTEEEVVEKQITPPEQVEFLELLQKYNKDYFKATFEYCFKHNIFYNSKIVTLLTVSSDIDQVINFPRLYLDTLDVDIDYKGQTFFDQLQLENFEKIYSEELSLSNLTESDRKNRQQVIDILSYDPFKDDDPLDKPQLYRDMATMLTEGMRKDVAKAKAALSIVRGYNNLEKYQQKITEIMRSGNVDEDTQKQLDQYMRIQKTIQDSINTTADKNNFTVKGIGSNGRGMLSDVMNQIEEKGIDEGVTNFYDIATSQSIEEVANISWKAGLNQINLSKTDYADILGDQANIVRECQEKARKAEEALRLAKEKITKQELLEELAMDYRKKNISEEEIEEFINREYRLYDGKQ